MSWINYDDVVRQLEGAGLLLDRDLTFDARIQRWKIAGGDAERRGWSRLKEWQSASGQTYIVGAYGVWHGTDDGKQKVEIAKRDGLPALSPADIAAIRAAQKETERRLKEERQVEAKTAAAWSLAVWSRCQPAPADHEYLVRKRIGAHGVRLLGDLDGLRIDGVDESNFHRLQSSRGALVVPMHDADANVVGIQFIYPAGHPRRQKIGRDKEFWPKGMAMGGSFGLTGPMRRSGVLLVAEGYATAASLHDATGLPVAYAFSANNLGKVVKAIRQARKSLRLLVCADDDYLTDGNPGVTAAAAACAEVEHAAWIKPDFSGPDGQDLRGGKKLTDFNDLAVLTGLPLTLANQINARLDALQWKDTPVRAASSHQGSGESARPDGRERARSVMSVEEIVERFIPLDDGTGKAVFDTWTRKPVSRDQMFAILPAGAKSDDIKRHPVWIERGAAYLDEVGFDPTERDPAVRLNTWRGWPLVPKEGKCERLLELLQYLCNVEDGGEEVYQWLLKWMAYPLQHPGAKMASAVIMHGPQGTGKSTVFQTLARIYGDYATVLNQRGLEDRFNADWIDSKLFILAEEVVARAELWHVRDELKELVTGEWIRVNPKFQGAYRQRNQVNLVYLSNHGQPLPLENDDRRHLVVWTPPMLGEDYYDEVFLEMEQGGTEAFYWYLLNEVDTTRFHPKKRPPMTDAKRALIHISLPSEQRFAEEWIAGDTPWPVCPCRAADFYTAYTSWCRTNGEARPRPSNQFLGSIARLPGWAKEKRRIHPEESPASLVLRPIVLPPREALQAHGTDHPPHESQTTWLTGAVGRFSEALKGQQWAEP